ncbi:MAG: hypothetical protein E7518_08430 [Ruminococcaceae bacterium]|nr:hypothetical protein [Oscillospiraceae bacterium]
MIENSFDKHIKYYIEMPGTISDSIGSVKIDNKFILIPVEPICSWSLMPYEKVSQPTFAEVVFYANCLAYEHELPTSIYSVNKKPFIKPIIGNNSYIGRSYDIITQAYEFINDIKFGFGNVVFRYSDSDKEVDIQYSIKYKKVARELSLYATALRQLDPLSEFLCYYRIIEFITGDNGKNWIEANITRINNYNFGFLELRNINSLNSKRKTNLFSIYRRKAMIQINNINKKYPGKLTHYLYNQNRCGVAHGKDNIIEYDFNYNVTEISKDNYIMKLLSRLSIEDKIL